MHWSFVTLQGDCLASMRQFACLVVNQIRLDNFAALYNCTPVDQASDSILLIGNGTLLSVVGPPDDLLLLQIFSYVAWQSRDLHLTLRVFILF